MSLFKKKNVDKHTPVPTAPDASKYRVTIKYTGGINTYYNWTWAVHLVSSGKCLDGDTVPTEVQAVKAAKQYVSAREEALAFKNRPEREIWL